MQFRLIVLCRLVVPFLDDLHIQFEEVANSIKNVPQLKLILISFTFQHYRKELAYQLAREVLTTPIADSVKALNVICSFENDFLHLTIDLNQENYEFTENETNLKTNLFLMTLQLLKRYDDEYNHENLLKIYNIIIHMQPYR